MRELAGSAASIASAWHAQAELTAALHRSYREGRLPPGAYLRALEQFISESNDGLFVWLPPTDSVQQRVDRFYQTAPATVFLRAADALHLACAAEHGFGEVHSHDRHVLAAAQHFGLRGVNAIGPETP